MLRRLVPPLSLLLLGCSAGPGPETRGDGARKQPERSTTFQLPAGLMRGEPARSRWARRPRFPRRDDEGLRVLPDGSLEEWQGEAVRWNREAHPVGKPPGFGGASDLEVLRLGLASYGSGVSLALEVRDDYHRPALATSAFGQADHVEVEIWPGAKGRGVKLLLGTQRQLVEFARPAQEWRSKEVSAAGVPTSSGYRVEARLPLSTLTPLQSPKVERIRYRITLFDADGEQGSAPPTLRLEGTASLSPPLEVPEAVQKRASVRLCVASQVGAVWGYRHGWRCAVPYHEDAIVADDTHPLPPARLGFTRIPSPPRIVWIRERLMFLNFIGARRGVAALLDGSETILSVMPLGVVGAQDPGNPRAHDSDAEHFKLPDGTYAVAAVHSLPAAPGPLGGRCAAGHRVYVSIIALRGCLRSTPHEPAPDPPFTPFIEEVFRAQLEDCAGSVANDWGLSHDRRTIKVHSSLFPARPPVVWEYRDGRYRRRARGSGAHGKP
jgi:hypothetical protein